MTLDNERSRWWLGKKNRAFGEGEKWKTSNYQRELEKDRWREWQLVGWGVFVPLFV